VAQVALLAQLDALTPIRVLVIDDDSTVRYTVHRFLGPNVAVLEAEDGVSGLRAAARLRPILILLDLQLPDMKGTEVLHQLKASPTTRDIPVAIVTSLELDAESASVLGREGAVVIPKSSLSGEALGRLLRAAHSADGMAEA